jgi:hypothetical protein
MDTEEVTRPATSVETEAAIVIKTYDCGICGQSAPSTDQRPMGLAVLIQV